MTAYIALGSNLGDRLANLRAAVDAIRSTTDVVAVSRVYESDPVGPPQPTYLNAVVAVETDLGPHALLDVLQGIEASLGRVRGERWGPRTIDLDLLEHGDAEVDDERLTLPHPRMRERAFVLVPLADVRPGTRVPGREGVRPYPEGV